MKSYVPAFALLSLILLGAGCATQPKWARYEVCFGMSADAGKTRISDQQWRQFRDQEIAGRFCDGFTVYHADGYSRSGSQTYSEPAEILMVVAPDSRDTQDKLDAIARAYARTFRQESVLQIKSPAEVIFQKTKANK